MAAYSWDLRKRVAQACDNGMPVAAVATRFDVSVAWVYRLLQRRRATGSISPRKQTKFRHRALSSDEEVRLAFLITVQPDATLAELQRALPTRAALSTLWRAIDRLGITVKKNRPRRRSHVSSRRSRAEPHERKLTPEIGAPDEPDFRIEVGTDRETFQLKAVAVGVIIEASEMTGLVALHARCARPGDVGIDVQTPRRGE